MSAIDGLEHFVVVSASGHLRSSGVAVAQENWDGWVRLVTNDFEPDRLKQLLQRASGEEDPFLQLRHPRLASWQLR